MTFFHYWKPFPESKRVDGAIVVGALKFNRSVYRVEKTKARDGRSLLTLMPVFALIYHPLDAEIQRALIECWIEDRKVKLTIQTS